MLLTATRKSVVFVINAGNIYSIVSILDHSSKMVDGLESGYVSTREHVLSLSNVIGYTRVSYMACANVALVEIGSGRETSLTRDSGTQRSSILSSSFHALHTANLSTIVFWNCSKYACSCLCLSPASISQRLSKSLLKQDRTASRYLAPVYCFMAMMEPCSTIFSTNCGSEL